MKFVWQISYPPVNGSSLGSFFVKKGWKQAYKNSVGRQTWESFLKLIFVCFGYEELNKFHPILFRRSWDYWGQILLDRQTNSLSPNKSLCGFATSLLASLARGLNKHGPGLNILSFTKGVGISEHYSMLVNFFFFYQLL